MKRYIALVTLATLIGSSVPVFADTTTTTTATTTTNQLAANNPSPAMTYTVQSGDALWKIAQQTGRTTSQIVAYNGLTNPDALQVGQVLNVPATWTVASGDTLWKISQAVGVSSQTILQANNLSNPDQLSVGQVLVIPSQSGSTTATAPTSSTNSMYTVKSGDTLWRISKATGASVAALTQANNLTNPDQLTVGQVLVVPSQAATTSTPTTTGTTTGATGTAPAGTTGSTSTKPTDATGTSTTDTTGATTGTDASSTGTAGSGSTGTAVGATTYSADGTASWTTGTDTTLGVPYKIGLESDGADVHSLVANGSDYEKFQVAVSDSIENAMGSGIPVTITSSDPSVATVALWSNQQIMPQASVTGTTSNGGFEIAVFAGTKTGTVTINATYGNIKTTQELRVLASPAKISISGPTTFTAQSGTVHNLVATVTDANGNPLPGVIVNTYCTNVAYFSPQYGPLKTNSKGQVFIALKSGGKVGTENLQLTVNNGIDQTNVPITTN